MADNQAQKTKRDLFGERLKSKYPDREYADDEALFGQIGDDYDEYERQIGEYKGREDKLIDMFAKDPKNAQFLADMANGKDPWIGVIEHLGIDGVTDLINDPDKQEEYAKANAEYLKAVAREKELKDEYEANLVESLANIERVQTERGLADEMVDAAMNLVLKIASEAIVGKFTPEKIELALKAVNHDADIANARSEGELAGKNAKIDEKMKRMQSGDGMPTMGGSNTTVPAAPVKKKGFFDDLPQRKF